MSSLVKEYRRFLVRIRHLFQHGKLRPYGRSYRIRKPRVLTQRPGLEITSPLEFIATHLGKPPEQFFFVQIGAFDGRHDEPMQSLIRKYRWRGILVEPQETAFQRLCQNYADQGQLTFRNVAIGTRDGMAEMYALKEGDSQIASFEYEHLIHHVRGHREIVNRTVPCLTLKTLLREEQRDHIDLLQIDAEGFDAEIIRSIDFESLRPPIIRYEHSNLLERDQCQCIELLADQGYRVLLEDADTIAYLEPPSVHKS